MENTSRRKFFKQGLSAVAVIAAAKVAESAVCKLSERQTSGPFIPNDFPFKDPNGEGAPIIEIAESDADLTVIEQNGQLLTAQGQVIHVLGKVVDQNCSPVAGATVYLWQADDHGHYNHAEDTNVHSSSDLDQGFQYRASMTTNSDGSFRFKTVKPKYYPLDETGSMMRTSHLHFAVLHPRCQQLITQTYFEGNVLEDIERIRELNKTDIILAPQGKILDKLRPLIIEFKANSAVAAEPVGEVTLTVNRIG